MLGLWDEISTFVATFPADQLSALPKMGPLDRKRLVMKAGRDSRHIHHALLGYALATGKLEPPKKPVSMHFVGSSHPKAPTRHSEVQAAIARALQATGIEYKNEWAEKETDYVCDFYVPEKNAIIEVDGPTHLLRPELKTENGATHFKKLLLEKLGYTVLTIDTREWQTSHRLVQGGEPYLKQLLGLSGDRKRSGSIFDVSN